MHSSALRNANSFGQSVGGSRIATRFLVTCSRCLGCKPSGGCSGRTTAWSTPSRDLLNSRVNGPTVKWINSSVIRGLELHFEATEKQCVTASTDLERGLEQRLPRPKHRKKQRGNQNEEKPLPLLPVAPSGPRCHCSISVQIPVVRE